MISPAVAEACRFLLEAARRQLLSAQSIGTFSALTITFLVSMIVRRIRPREWRDFFSREVGTDAVYTVFYLGGIYTVVVGAPVYRLLSAAVQRYAPALRADALATLPAPVHFVLLWLAMDLIGYGWHRLAHGTPLLWRFHKVHHTQGQLTPLTNYRFHFVDILTRTTLQFIPAIVLGSPAGTWLIVAWLQVGLEAFAHADVPWTYSAFGRLLVSPAFHRQHHSIEPRHFGRNFGLSFSVWDYLFGTAVPGNERPHAFGLEEPHPRGFLRQLFWPFIGMARGRAAPALRPAAGGRSGAAA